VSERVDLSDWPLVELDVTVDAPAGAAASVAVVLRAALDRSEPFAAVLQVPAASGRDGRAAGVAERARMLRQLRPGLAQRCRGLAFVTPVGQQHASVRLARSGPRLWGCPVTVTSDLAQARAWARAQLERPAPGRAGDS
jgi:hypothetical protein